MMTSIPDFIEVVKGATPVVIPVVTPVVV